jgi:putative flippase GtrA
MCWTKSTGVMARLFAYSVVGVLNTLSDFLVFMLLTSGLGYHSVPANVASYSVGVMLSFIMNRKFTFRSSFYAFDLKRQFVRFCAVNLLSLGMSTALVYFFSQSMPPPLAKILSVPFVLMWGFLAVRTFVFASPEPGDMKHSQWAEEADAPPIDSEVEAD